MSLTETDPAGLVGLLADPHRRTAAYPRLLALGPAATEAAEDGLHHPNPSVRANCAKLLDHLAQPGSYPILIAALDDPDPAVRVQVVHALACDRCKSDGCRPDAARVVPPGLRLLTGDPSPKVRNVAVELVGVWAHSRRECAAALEVAAHRDPSPAVRKKASWYAPGGVVYRRTLTKSLTKSHDRRTA